MADIMVVGGTYNTKGGKPSNIVKKLVEGIRLFKGLNVYVENGGNYNLLMEGFETPATDVFTDVILWMPNIPNNLPKFLDIKKIFPKTILVSSKNNIFNEYSFQDIVAHGLNLKSNLILEITKNDEKFAGRLIDTLGNVWHDTTTDFIELGTAIAIRSKALINIKRQATIYSPEEIDPIDKSNTILEFFEVVKDIAKTFHDLIHPAEGITRFLGNASFRCERGFPSIRTRDNQIYVSRRNVDKRSIGPDTFVQVGLNEETDTVWYRGDHKPSVDTVIQIKLYKAFKDVNYMIHSHVYVENAPFTSKMIPCGGLQEIDEILKVVSENNLRHRLYFAINLKGHGSIIFMRQPSNFEYFKFIPRPMPEFM